MISGGGNSITSETRSRTRATARRGSIHKSIADPPPALHGEEQQPSDAANAVHAIGTGAAIALARVNMTQAFGVHMIPMVMRVEEISDWPLRRRIAASSASALTGHAYWGAVLSGSSVQRTVK
jgi:hypothetical protein